MYAATDPDLCEINSITWGIVAVITGVVGDGVTKAHVGFGLRLGVDSCVLPRNVDSTSFSKISTQH